MVKITLLVNDESTASIHIEEVEDSVLFIVDDEDGTAMVTILKERLRPIFQRLLF